MARRVSLGQQEKGFYQAHRVRTPHLFASTFFVHLADFLSHIFDDGHAGVNHLSMRAAECAAGLGTGLGFVGQSSRRRAAAEDDAARRQAAVSLRITQPRFLSSLMQGRTDFRF